MAGSEACAGVDDADVIERSIVDAALFAVLFDRHFRALHRFLCGRVGAQLADDLASETFAVAFRRRGSYDRSRPDAAPWLYGIAVNLLRDHRRSEERRLRAYARLEADASVGIGEAVPPAMLDPAVVDALLALSVLDRDIVLLHAWAGLSSAQLGDALGLAGGTVRSRLSRACARLRSTLVPVDAAQQEPKP
jgi:RNA polymerase sigma factor (sigma-70 family)